jgi:hypothetical protein
VSLLISVHVVHYSFAIFATFFFTPHILTIFPSSPPHLTYTGIDYFSTEQLDSAQKISEIYCILLKRGKRQINVILSELQMEITKSRIATTKNQIRNIVTNLFFNCYNHIIHKAKIIFYSLLLYRIIRYYSRILNTFSLLIWLYEV